ncbi:MAG: hypothetical protein CMN32_15635 [Saprospirales bacterium]|nr:hypothetical protein [Saprospirales bacterium]
MKQNTSLRVAVCGLFFILFAFQHSAFSQVMQCRNTDPSNPGILSPATNCIADIDEATVLDTMATTSPGPFIFVIKELSGDTIAWDTTLVSADLQPYLGDTIAIEAIDISNGLNCTSYWDVRDLQPPVVLSCVNDTIPSTHPLDTASLPAVIAMDNCGGPLTLSYVDAPFGPDCNNPIPEFIGALVRSWTIEDQYGNQNTSCQQTFFIEKPSVDSVEFPADYFLDCSETSADPSITGVPTLAGFPISVGGFNTLTVSYDDIDTLQACGGHPLILRQWTVWDICENAIRQDTQQVVFLDTTPPTINCVDTITVETDTLVCTTDVTLPLPSVLDDCSGTSITVTTPGFGSSVSLNDVPKGTYVSTFTVTDSCGNASTCQTVVVVEDNETPVAVCDGLKILALPYPTGVITLDADAFDAGSTDNCSPVDFEVSRDGGVTYSPTVTFTCDDLFDTIMVRLRVFETVNPASENFCMNSVVLQDKLAPVFTTCPANTVVDCGTDLSDLSVFGEPVVIDNCNVTLTAGTVSSINSTCGTGTITRTWTAVDSSGNPAECTQVISVQNLTPYDGSTIVWPLDTNFFNLCTVPGAFHPDSLPAGYNYPQVSSTQCEMLAINYSDQIFYFANPSAFKIVRTWSVLDWCQYNPANPGVGVWTHQQVIALMDTEAPTIVSAPSDTIVGLNNTCTFGSVVLDPVVATDCNQGITITNDSPYAFSNGADASGNYPAGVHTVTFTVTDGSGNSTTTTVTITVTDLKLPTPYCNSGVAAELQDMMGNIMTTVYAEQLNNASWDNCTDTSALSFTIRLLGDTLPPAPSLTFDCSQRGMHQVEMWVTDQAGNSDYCITTIIIQDNMVVCPPDTLVAGSAMIAGEVESMMGEKMPQVPVHLDNMGLMNYTGNVGDFEFFDLTPNGAYTVKPEKNDDTNNGVTTYDLVIIGRHVLNVSLITDPYKLIAADINNNGSVTTADIVELRKLILNIYHEFPNNTSWRFIPKSYVFPNPANPFNPPFPEQLYINSLSQDVYDANFIGVKIGDLNGSAIADVNGNHVDERNTYGELTLLTEDRKVSAGETVTVPVAIADYTDLLALQFTLEFETDDLELQGIEKGALPGTVEEYFGTTRVQDGILTAGWFSLYPTSLEQGSTLFSLSFKAKKEGKLSDMLRLTSRITSSMAYDQDEVPLNLNLAFNQNGQATSNQQFELFQNQPNPFTKVTSIGFNLPSDERVKLTIYDLAGNVLKTMEQDYSKGYHEVRILKDELPTTGVLIYKLETNGFTDTKKMVLLN